MTLLAPGFLIAAVAAAFGVIALHFIVTRRPRSIAFPTARFVPDAPIAARARSLRLSDLLLLAIRVAAILLVGLALARPVFTPSRERVARVIAADVSASAASIAEVRDSVRTVFRPGDALVAFDTNAWRVESVDSVIRGAGAPSSGSLSAGLVAALRAASGIRAGADSLELVVVSPVARDEEDRATGALRAQWPGRARLVRVNASRSVDSTNARTQQVEFLSAQRPLFAVARRTIDTAGAVVADGNVLVARFERRWRYAGDSLKDSRVIARWGDGEPAAIERGDANTCRKSVAIPLDSAGDMVLRPGFVRFRQALSASCGHVASGSDSALATLLIGDAGRLASVTQFPSARDIDSPLARWLILLALILTVLEIAWRRGQHGAGTDQ